jgi:hypothetical protein
VDFPLSWEYGACHCCKPRRAPLLKAFRQGTTLREVEEHVLHETTAPLVSDLTQFTDISNMSENNTSV